MLKPNIIRAIGCLVLFNGSFSCSHIRHRTALSNVKIVENKGKPRIREDDFVALSYTVTTADGKGIYGNYHHTLFREKSDFEGDFFGSLGMLGEGDSAIIEINIDSMIAYKRVLPKNINGKYVLYYVRVNKVIGRVGEPGHTSDSVLNAAIEECRKQEVDNDKKREDGLLKRYIAESGLKYNITPSGLYYFIDKMGSGAKPRSGDLSFIYFTGKYTDGELFFTNNKAAAQEAGTYEPGKSYLPLEMYIGKHLFIPGLEEGLLLMPGGTKARLVIPSKLSDGERYGYAPLVCDIEVLSTRHVKPGERIKMLHGDEDEGETRK